MPPRPDVRPGHRVFLLTDHGREYAGTVQVVHDDSATLRVRLDSLDYAMGHAVHTVLCWRPGEGRWSNKLRARRRYELVAA